jgi:hypothetical protein
MLLYILINCVGLSLLYLIAYYRYIYNDIYRSFVICTVSEQVIKLSEGTYNNMILLFSGTSFEL